MHPKRRLPLHAPRLFLALYSPLAVVTFARVVGGLALQPLEAARRLAQRKVFERYGGTITRRKLRELAAGPLVKRLDLSANDAFCTRDEYTLLTLVLQGKISEADLIECRAAFKELDATASGFISIEDLELVKQRQKLRLEPRIRQRRLRRVRSALQVPILERAEAFFPYWATARGERENGNLLDAAEGVEEHSMDDGDAEPR